MSTLTWPTSRLIHRSIHRPTYLGCYIGRESVHVLTDTSVKCRSICRLIHWLSVGQYDDRYIARGVHKIHMIQKFQSGQHNLQCKVFHLIVQHHSVYGTHELYFTLRFVIITIIITITTTTGTATTITNDSSNIIITFLI